MWKYGKGQEGIALTFRVFNPGIPAFNGGIFPDNIQQATTLFNYHF